MKRFFYSRPCISNSHTSAIGLIGLNNAFQNYSMDTTPWLVNYQWVHLQVSYQISSSVIQKFYYTIYNSTGVYRFTRSKTIIFQYWSPNQDLRLNLYTQVLNSTSLTYVSSIQNAKYYNIVIFDWVSNYLFTPIDHEKWFASTYCIIQFIS